MHHPSVLHLVIHSGYHAAAIALYRDTHPVAVQELDKKTVSAFLMPSILKLLQEHTLHFKNISFITAHAGPAPFTTLRIGIATANGIGFATGIPLIGINGLAALSAAYPEYTVILNAFCNDVYIGKNGQTSCENIDLFIQKELVSPSVPVTYIGNAVPLYYEQIKNMLGYKAQLINDYPYEANIDLIAQAGYTRWLKKENLTNQIIPMYLKHYSAKVS